jgi:hypothetical protein
LEVITMSEQEPKAKLERVLRTKISAAEWLDINDQGYVRECDDGDISWREFCELVAEALGRLRRHVENVQREQRGELLLEPKIPEQRSEPTSVTDNIFAPLSEGTAARVGALNALDQLHLGPKAWGVVGREMRSRVRPAGGPDEALPQWVIRPVGGLDDALPQWVIELEVEAWVPAEDVRNIYQHVQRDLLSEEDPTKTQPRTYRVAQFVWQEELRCGKRPPWPDLLKRWKERNPDDDVFKSWRAFHTCFRRGEKATPPRYARENEQIASEAENFRYREARRLRQRLQHLPE